MARKGGAQPNVLIENSENLNYRNQERRTPNCWNELSWGRDTSQFGAELELIAFFFLFLFECSAKHRETEGKRAVSIISMLFSSAIQTRSVWVRTAASV